MDRPLWLDLDIPRAIGVRVLAILAMADLILIVGTAAAPAIPPGGGFLSRVSGQLDLTGESNAAAWYASLVLFLVALSAVVAWMTDEQRERPPGERRMTRGWLVVAALFAMLSLDELTSLHERPDWLALFLAPIVLAAAFLLVFGWRRFRSDRLAWGLHVTGILLFLSVPVQEVWGVGTGVFEEATELFAALCFLAAFFRVTLAGTDSVVIRVRTTLSSALQGLGAFAATGAVLMVGLELMSGADTHPRQGAVRPSQWFGGCAATMGSILALWTWGTSRFDPGFRSRRLYLWVGLHAAVTAFDQGTNLLLSRRLFEHQPLLHMIVVAALAVPVAILGLVLTTRARGLGPRLGYLTWASLTMWSFLVEPGFSPALAYTGYIALLVALLFEQADATQLRYAAVPPLDDARRGPRVARGGS